MGAPSRPARRARAAFVLLGTAGGVAATLLWHAFPARRPVLESLGAAPVLAAVAAAVAALGLAAALPRQGRNGPVMLAAAAALCTGAVLFLAALTEEVWSWLLLPPFACAILAALTGLGSTALRRLHVAPRSIPLEITLAGIAGCWIAATLTLAAGVIGIAQPGAVRLIWAGLALAGLPGLHRLGRAGGRAFSRLWRSGPALLRGGIALAVPFLGICLLNSLTVETDYDALEYHLALPRHYLDLGRIGPAPQNLYSWFPQGAEMLYLGALALAPGHVRGGLLAHGLHAGALLLALPALYCGARAVTRRPAFGALACLLLCACFLTTWLAGRAYVEMWQILAAAAAGACLLAPPDAWRRPADRWLACGLAAGYGLTIKYTSIACLLLPVTAMALLWPAVETRRGQAPANARRRLHGPAILVGAALIAWMPWALRNALWIGDPLFPLLGRLVPGVDWDAQLAAQFQQVHSRLTITPRALGALLGSFFAGREGRTEEPNSLGPILLIAPLLALLIARRRTVAALLGWYLGVFALWATVTDHVERFLFPLAPIGIWLAVAALAALPALLRRAARRARIARRDWAGWVALLYAPLWLPYTLRQAWGIHTFRNVIGIDVRGTERAAGATLESELLSYLWQGNAGTNDYFFWRAVNDTLARAGPLWLLGEAQTYHLDPRGLTYATVFTRHPLEALVKGADSVEALRAALRGAGDPALAFHWEELRRLETTHAFTDPATGRTCGGYWDFAPRDWALLRALVTDPQSYRRSYPAASIVEVRAGPDWAAPPEATRAWALSYDGVMPTGATRAPRVEILLPATPSPP